MLSNYLSVAEIAEKWDVSPRYVQNLCKEGRIKGAEKFGKVWAIPNNTPRPLDLRIKTGKYKDWRNRQAVKHEKK